MTTTSVSSSTTSQQLVAADPSRSSVVISNTDSGRLYWLYGDASAGPTAGSFTDYLDLDDTLTITGYEATLAIQGIWGADGSGGASITTIVPTPLSGAGSSAILAILQDVAPEIGLNVPDQVFSSTVREHIELKRTTNKALEMIRKAHRWQKLVQRAVYTGDDATEDFDLPADFDWMTDDQQVWGSAQQRPLTPIQSQDEWLGFEVRQFTVGDKAWIIFGGQMHVKEAMATGETAQHFYQSTAAVQPVSGVAKSTFTLDTDTFRLNDELLRLAIIYLWKQGKGQNYQEFMTDYEILKEKLITRDKGATVLKIGSPRMPRDATIAFPLNVPIA